MNAVLSRMMQMTLGVCLSALPTFAQGTSQAPAAAKLITASSGCPGGICVVLGGRTSDLALAVSKQGPYVVQALVPDEASLDQTRSALRAGGAYGLVSADRSTYEYLPYAENLINIVVVQDYADAASQGLSIDEVFRVLAPLGAAYFGNPQAADNTETGWIETLTAKLSESGFSATQVLTDAATWVRVVKPWPKDIDEWTHYLHGADGNAVAQDRVVGPPEHYQWISEPLWLRSHESDSSVRTMVSSRGRLFYIADEAPISLVGDHDLPDKWFLTARDAFNGVLLWKVPIEDWGWRAWKPSWFSPRPGDIPLNIQKRLVAVAEKLYVTLGYRAPVSEIDGGTGKLLKTYDATARTAEILYHEGSLILTVLENDGARIKRVDAQSGKTLWTCENSYRGTVTDYYRFTAMHGSVPPAEVDPTLNIATDGAVVALLDGQDVVCLDFKSGKESWRARFPLVEADFKAGGINAQRTLWSGTLIVRDGAVVHASPNQLAAFSARSGEILWQQPKKFLQHLWFEWKDVFVIDGLVWTWSAETVREPLETDGRPTKSMSVWPVSANGYDLHTGKLTREVPLGNIFKTYHHHRCYRNKATVRYILASRRGSEFVDLEEGNHSIHNWVRGTCHVGMMPANGLQYAPPHPCVCYIEEKLNGMNALAPRIPSQYRRAEREVSERLERGPAYGQIRGTSDPRLRGDRLAPAEAGGRATNDWPAYRHDSLRSGAAQTEVPAALKLLWQSTVGRKLSAPVVADGRVFVSLIDEHHVAALDGNNGRKIWESAAGARVDSPPTYYRGTVIFGSRDGWVYCLRAADGARLWRFAAAPRDRRIGAFGQLESAWPVHGSVLVQDGIAYFAAGRSSELDGGIYLYGVDALSGELRCQTKLEGPHYNVGNISQNYQLPMGALPDILQGDGRLIYMRELTFSGKLEKQDLPPRQTSDRVSPKATLLDDSYFKRTPWYFGGADNYARLIVHDERTAYFVRMFDSLQGLDPNVYFTPGKKGYLLFGIDRTTGRQTWAQRLPVRVNAMVVTPNLLFIAGPPDVVDPQDPLGAFEGRKGAVLLAIDRTSGGEMWRYSLPSPPAFDGLAAAAGRLYMALQDGGIACFGP
ncbi:MAG TPA: PQQ-binding-like beta-propeller repeat protein [Sedimentisphaerales bacterium]|nr:PQQ-binding-like beta-propeller repeat protein [Sedimentisphaerales bacterium]